VETPRREIVLPRALYIAGALLITGFVVYWLRDVLTPIFLAFIIAYILDPVVDRLEAWKVPRPLGIAIVFGATLGAVVVFLALVLPGIVADVASVIQELPSQFAALWLRIEPWLEQQGISIPHSTQEWVERFGAYTSEVASSLLAPAGNVLRSLMGGTLSVIGSVVAALVVLVFGVYLLSAFDRITAEVTELIPRRWRATVISYAEEIDQMLSQFVRGQLTVMAILAVLYSGAYALLGVRLAVPIGITAGMLNFIPYVGGAFALATGVLMSLLGGWHPWQLVGVVVAYTLVQTLEGFVITPRVVGKTVGLSEIWVLVALFVGGEIFGFLGVLLALPTAAIAKIFVSRGVQYYRTTDLFLRVPPDSASDRSLTTPEVLAKADDTEHDQQLPMPPRRGQREC
jgi:predicted PurR-regulated permease PerM